MIFDLKPLSHITIDTIGPPGERVFYLQGGRGPQVVTLIIEKEHALALVSGLDDLFAELPASQLAGGDHVSSFDVGLQQPVEPLFRVGQMGLAYDESSDMVVLVAYQLASEDQEDVPAVRFWGTREQMRTLRRQALSAVEGGRPVCSLCGGVMEPGGHLCPRRNGHGNHPQFSSL
jgi:uncharacterized repeat protein (TIGR03847 family)